ncbi:hypothetical protein Tco_0752261 [Tanacetum coccineum]|uniref:Uncharacterized protein n=1 Tax=Tanacetum coccineum TaxID=301880 RepID=A0ABQ4Z9I3_9ASTR
MDNVFCISNDITSIEFDKNIETNHDDERKPSKTNFEEILGKIYGRGVHRVQVFDFGGLTDLMAEGLSSRMLIEHRDTQGQMGQDVRGNPLQMGILSALWRGYLSAYWRGDLILRRILGTAPSSLQSEIRCVGCANRYLMRFASGSKRGVLISGGQFVAPLAKHFGLLTEERLQGLTVIVAKGAPDIDEGVHRPFTKNLLQAPSPSCSWGPARALHRKVQDCKRVTSLSLMMDRSGVSFYELFRTPYTRLVKCRRQLGPVKASTSAVPLDEDQPDP